eukprot:CAMPEP_0202968052 /NCGR_PEP_ID=MMETSP1396-20130829/13169_1 /ASSEMBLY_ACC=CAM_ASM_000872 /TAXON_ID= /ORGANISM="Pseudokeronopsis sp., Strain Brazil" /LENGTH=63 /DNA_ID=CAMNT_0049693887 /DNA_START=108 /DNA_END=296 /DNA_ORIENTATION=+
MFKTLTKERFRMMEQDHTWRNTFVKVCDGCFLDLTTNQFASAQNKKRLVQHFHKINQDANGSE